MPPKEQTFDAETMAIVLFAMGQSGVKLGTAHYKMMSEATKGARGVSAFDHQFRAVKKRADEIAANLGKTADKGSPTGPESDTASVEETATDLCETPTKPVQKISFSIKGNKRNAAGMGGKEDDESTPSKKPKKTQMPFLG